MGCCSKKKSAKSKKTMGKKGAKPSDKSKKGAKKPVLPGAKVGAKKVGGAAASSKSASSKRITPKGKSPGPNKAAAGGKAAPSLQRVPADKRPTKTPSTASSTKSAKSAGPSSASSKKGAKSTSESAKSPNPAADARQAKKRENHAKSLNKNGVKGATASTPSSDVTTARSPPYDPKKGTSKELDKGAKKIPAAPPVPPPKRDARKKEDKQQPADVSKSSSASQSRGSSVMAARNSSARAPRARRVSRSKLPMQKLTISSHIEEGIVVSQWYYTELRELGTQPSSVADLLQGGPRQQLNLPSSGQQQQS